MWTYIVEIIDTGICLIGWFNNGLYPRWSISCAPSCAMPWGYVRFQEVAKRPLWSSGHSPCLVGPWEGRVVAWVLCSRPVRTVFSLLCKALGLCEVPDRGASVEPWTHSMPRGTRRRQGGDAVRLADISEFRNEIILSLKKTQKNWFTLSFIHGTQSVIYGSNWYFKPFYH